MQKVIFNILLGISILSGYYFKSIFNTTMSKKLLNNDITQNILHKSNNNNIISNHHNENVDSNFVNSKIQYESNIASIKKSKVKVIVNNQTENKNGLNFLRYGYYISYYDYNKSGTKTLHKYRADGNTSSSELLGSDDIDSVSGINGHYIVANELFNIKIHIDSAIQPNVTVSLDKRYSQIIKYQELKNSNSTNTLWYSIEATGILTCPKIILVQHWLNLKTNKTNNVIIGQYGVYNFYQSNYDWTSQLIQILAITTISAGVLLFAGALTTGIIWKKLQELDVLIKGNAFDNDFIELNDFSSLENDVSQSGDNRRKIVINDNHITLDDNARLEKDNQKITHFNNNIKFDNDNSHNLNDISNYNYWEKSSTEKLFEHKKLLIAKMEYYKTILLFIENEFESIDDSIDYHEVMSYRTSIYCMINDLCNMESKFDFEHIGALNDKFYTTSIPSSLLSNNVAIIELSNNHFKNCLEEIIFIINTEMLIINNEVEWLQRISQCENTIIHISELERTTLNRNFEIRFKNYLDHTLNENDSYSDNNDLSIEDNNISVDFVLVETAEDFNNDNFIIFQSTHNELDALMNRKDYYLSYVKQCRECVQISSKNFDRLRRTVDIDFAVKNKRNTYIYIKYISEEDNNNLDLKYISKLNEEWLMKGMLSDSKLNPERIFAETYYHTINCLGYALEKANESIAKIDARIAELSAILENYSFSLNNGIKFNDLSTSN